MILGIPDPSLVLLVGPAGCGKSTFARRHFRPTEVLSSDFFRAMVADDEADQSASKDAFDLLHLAAAKRLGRRLLTVIDATNVKPEARRSLHDLARHYHLPICAIVFNLPAEVCLAYNQDRVGRTVDPEIIRSHVQLLQLSLRELDREGIRPVHVLASPEQVESAVVQRQPLPVDRRGEHGPFDIIGDVHGCQDELLALLGKLGYEIVQQAEADGRPGVRIVPPAGRRAVFVGDLVDRGPNVPAVLRLVMGMVEAGSALCVIGNHDDKLRRKLRGNPVKVAHGLAVSLAQLEPEPEDFKSRVRQFLDELPSHYLLDDGKLVVAHAGLPEELQGRISDRVRAFALYGQTKGEMDDLGLPVRLNWAAEYHGRAAVVYGHTPVSEPVWVNRTINIDTGCVFGGRLTALRYPENELVSVPAARVYAETARPFLPPVPQ
jgi:protein phosphatase